jgi:hypothetical protein
VAATLGSLKASVCGDAPKVAEKADDATESYPPLIVERPIEAGPGIAVRVNLMGQPACDLAGVIVRPDLSRVLFATVGRCASVALTKSGNSKI